MSYACFVSQLYECIKENSLSEQFSLSVFAEGPDALKQEHSGTQEYAILRNEYARTFADVMNNECFQQFTNRRKYVVKKSLLKAGEVTISHSCYPKNLRRWMSGTALSRKKKCRAELCALVWCWFFWIEEINPRVDKQALEKAFLDICHEYTEEGDLFQPEVLCKASDCAYRQTLR